VPVTTLSAANVSIDGIAARTLAWFAEQDADDDDHDQELDEGEAPLAL
jgi:hypothetical protein